MRVQGFNIEHFANPEYTRGGSHSLNSVSGGDILVRGENQSGKTHTFNAVLYGLLGETIALQTGHGNSVELELSDGFNIFRGEPGRQVHDGDQEYGPEEAENAIQEAVGPRELIHLHFLPSRISELPLERLLPRQRIDRVLAASSDDLGRRITELQERVEQLDEEIERREAELSSLEREEKRRNRQLSNIKSQLEKWSTVEELAETSRLAEISDALKQDPVLERRINELTSKKRGLITDIREKQNERTRAKELEEETRDIIVKALEEFICPVCEERVNRSEAENRLDNENCPFCNQTTDIRGTVSNLEAEKEQSEGQLDEINQELSELQETHDEVDSQIKSLKAERPDISELNSYAVTLLRDFDHNIHEIYEKAVEKRGQAEEELENYSQKLQQLEQQIQEVEESLSNVTRERAETVETMEQLEDEDVSTRISDFEQLWNQHYQDIAPQIAQEFNLERDGQIVLQTDEERDREYDRRGDLADAEIVLLNISFTTALNETALNRGSVNWETIVMDEPLTRLDTGIKQDALDHLKDQDIQIILTSSDEYVWQEFDQAAVLNLERQSRLTDFTDD